MRPMKTQLVIDIQEDDKDDPSYLAEMLEYIGSQIKDGYTSGKMPNWSIVTK
jgi:hypothetical protein